MNLLFIPSLLSGDYRTFFIKLIIVFALWIIAIMATAIDLKTGIEASRRLGDFKTNSAGLRQTIRKDLQYFTMLIVALLFDFVFSYLTTLTDIISVLGIFRIPLFTIVSVIIVLVIEGISVKENLEKGTKQIVSPELIKSAIEIIEKLGDEKTKAVLEILKDKGK